MRPFRDQLAAAHEAHRVGYALRHHENNLVRLKGHVFLSMWDGPTGAPLHQWDQPNVITMDASLLMAALMKNPLEPKHGINMLAVGTGAVGSILNPDAPGKFQRQLNNEIARKSFAETTFRDSNGAKSLIRTPVVDFTTIFGEGEAVGPLNEMGLISTISDNPAVKNPNPNQAHSEAEYDPTIDTSLYDVQVNYLTFGVVTKASTSVLAITWRLQF